MRICATRIDAARKSEALEGDDLYASEDVRTLEVKFGVNGGRHRPFRETILEMQQVDFDDFLLEPRTYISILEGCCSCFRIGFWTALELGPTIEDPRWRYGHP